MIETSSWPGRPNRRTFLMGASAAALTGCTGTSFPVNETGQEALQEEVGNQDLTFIRVTPENIDMVGTPHRVRAASRGANPPPPVRRYSYRVGVGDQLRIDFYADPARMSETGDLTPSTTPVIDETGQFFYPFIGPVRAVSRTAGQIRDDLINQLEAFFATPQVEVSVTQFNARNVTITGAVGAPGKVQLTNVPLTLLDLVNQSGVDENADLSAVRLRREGRHYTVNLQAFLTSGNPRQNPVLLDGDFILVPVRENDKVFTFGEIAVAEVPLFEARKSLVEVLAEVGGIDRIRADARGIFVFRRDDPARKGFDIYQFDLSNASALVTASAFEMASLDIIFVTNDPATRWSDTVGKIIQPFDSLLRARTTFTSFSED